jgi:outer membrane protein assembly factor BamD (BamD/ComL family)
MKTHKCPMPTARARFLSQPAFAFLLFALCILTGCASGGMSSPAGVDATFAPDFARGQAADDTKKDDTKKDDTKKDESQEGTSTWKFWEKWFKHKKDDATKDDGKTDAAKTDPAKTDPAKTGLAKTGDTKKKDELEDGASAWKFWDKWFTPQVPEGAPETLVFRGDKFETEKPLGKSSDKLAGAHEYYRQGDYDNARALFHAIADNNKVPPTIAEEARFYEAESLRRMGKYPKACDTYHKMLQDFPSGAYRELACQRMFDIANFWLKDTRDEMEKYEDKGGKSGFALPALHWEKEKPFGDEEGRALEALEHVHLNDPTGPLADKSLFLAGSVKFYRQDYREADHYFTQLIELHPNSPLCDKAVELGIICKHLGTGGADYDGRKVAEARLLIDKALRSYPKLANDPEKRKFLSNQLICCTMQQAEKDYRMAEFYRRTRHPCSAYFYYEIVRRRYPGTPFADQATEKMWEIRKEVEKKEADQAAKGEKTPRQRAQEETAPPPQTVPPGGLPAQPETAPPPRTVPPGGFPAQPATASSGPSAAPPSASPPPSGSYVPASPRTPVPMEGLPAVPGSVPQTLPPAVTGH